MRKPNLIKSLTVENISAPYVVKSFVFPCIYPWCHMSMWLMFTTQWKRKIPEENVAVIHATERVHRNTATSILNDFILYNRNVVKHYSTNLFNNLFLNLTGRGPAPKFRGYGVIGSHVRFRLWCRKACRFESCYPHQQPEAYANWSEATDSDIDQKERSTTCLIWWLDLISACEKLRGFDSHRLRLM